jgi:hypothetical protein
MTAQESGVSTVVSSADAATERRVVRRASQLCLGAEPHAEQSPCPAHVAEARRQLVGVRG